MEEWKERLIIEHKELKEKLAKLVEFINSEGFYKLSVNYRQVLKNQKIVMELYLQVLSMRVFEDIEDIVVPDYGMLQMLCYAFSGNQFGRTDEMKKLEKQIEKMTESLDEANGPE